MPPDPSPPPCASHGCNEPGTNETPRHTPRGVFYVWLCDGCQDVRNDVIRERNEEWWGR